MECGVPSDLNMFPGCADVVRIGTDRWTERDADILDSLCGQTEVFLKSHSHLPFNDLVWKCETQEPRVEVNGQYAFILCGPSGAFFIEDDELKSDIRGLVYRPSFRRKANRIVAEF